MANRPKANRHKSKPRTKAPSRKARNEWTVMVYLAGDNNLSEEMIYAIKEMYRVGTNGQFEVIVKFDPSAVGPLTRSYTIGDNALSEFSLNPTRRKRIKPGTPSKEKPNLRPEEISDEVKEEIKGQTEGTFDLDGFLEGLADVSESPDSPVPTSSKITQRHPGLQFQTDGKTPIVENSADPETLKNFIHDSIMKHSAEHYMLVLSGHGSGVDGDFLPDFNPDKPRELATSLSIPALGKVLEDALGELKRAKGDGKPILGEGQGIDILGMDCCLMSMAEVGFEVTKSVKFLVASEGFELNTGWPYHRILETMKKKLTRRAKGSGASGKNSDLPPLELATTIVRKYLDYYKDYQLAGASTDISACELKGMTLLAQKVGRLAKALEDRLNDPHIENAIVLAHWDAQTYKGDQYVDLWDFCTRLELYLFRAFQAKKPVKKAVDFLDARDDSHGPQSIIAASKHVPKASRQFIKQCEAVKSAITPGVVKQSGHSGAAFQHSHGISIYFPWAESDFFPIDPDKKYESLSEKEREPLSKYENLNFAKKVAGGQAWVKFLRKYLKETRRDRRDEAEHTKRGDQVERFDAPNETVLFVRTGTSNCARTSDSGTGSMKNPPDGFYQDNLKR